MRLAHLSDLHFGHHDETLSSGLAADLASQAPDLIVVSGDFTQHGTPDEFAAARAFLDTLAVPVFAVPGNHDLGHALLRRFFNPYGHYRTYIAPDIEPFMEAGGLALAGLNTTRRAHLDRNWANGAVNLLQLERLAEAFRKSTPGLTRVVVAHHPLMRPELATAKPTRAAKRAGLALEALAALDVRLVLSGHFHLSFVRRYEPNVVLDGIPPGPREAADAPILVAQASSTISTRLRGEPNAYNLIDFDGGAITIRVREWQEGRWATREKASAATEGPRRALIPEEIP
jgi:3',5'-cyclic AMP phosphodiesterase CpdA